MRIKSLLKATVLSVATAATLVATTAPAEAVFVKACVTEDQVTFSPTLTVFPGTYDVGVAYGPGTTCRLVDLNTLTVSTAGPVPVAGTLIGNCVAGVLESPYFTGVLIGSSVWVTADTGAGFIAAVGTKVLVPVIPCAANSAFGAGVGVMVG